MSSQTEPWGLLAGGLAVILIRIGVRWTTVGPRNWKVDDYVVILVAVAWILEGGVSTIIGKSHGLNNSLMTPEERAALPPSSPLYDMRVVGSKAMLGNIFIYTSILWSLKLCLTVFYGRLTHEIIDLTLRVRIAYLLLAITYVIVNLTYLLGCHPFAGYWQVNPDPGNACYAVLSRVNILIVGIPNILTDIFLMSIPFPLIWRASLSTSRKVILCVLFSGGLFVVAATIVRMTSLLSGDIVGYLQGSIWTDREAFAAIMVTNTPVIYPVIAKFVEKQGHSMSNTFNSGATKSSWTKMGDNNASQTTTHQGHEASEPHQEQQQQHYHYNNNQQQYPYQQQQYGYPAAAAAGAHHDDIELGNRYELPSDPRK